MAAVIQATCPGCKKMLRIPSDWIQQAIRCKHCGLSWPPSRLPLPFRRKPSHRRPTERTSGRHAAAANGCCSGRATRAAGEWRGRAGCRSRDSDHGFGRLAV